MKKKLKFTLFNLGLVLACPAISADHFAKIIAVNAYKAPYGSHYIFNATIKSSDRDCQHYVNWWEAVSEKGELLYRRILVHPHSKEQPFNRGGSGVLQSIDKKAFFYVRAHMHPFGYSRNGMKGSLKTGFEPVIIPNGFANNLEEQGQLPSYCDPSLDQAR